jgi:hypothetical protein
MMRLQQGFAGGGMGLDDQFPPQKLLNGPSRLFSTSGCALALPATDAAVLRTSLAPAWWPSILTKKEEADFYGRNAKSRADVPSTAAAIAGKTAPFLRPID